MGKIRIRLYKDGTIKMETNGIKGKKCTDYAKLMEKLLELKLYNVKTTEEYYETDEEINTNTYNDINRFD